MHVQKWKEMCNKRENSEHIINNDTINKHPRQERIAKTNCGAYPRISTCELMVYSSNAHTYIKQEEKPTP